jgi:hypothetical protein
MRTRAGPSASPDNGHGRFRLPVTEVDERYTTTEALAAEREQYVTKRSTAKTLRIALNLSYLERCFLGLYSQSRQLECG